MTLQKKTDPTLQLEQGKILPLVLRLTVPAVVAQLITFLYNIVDRMYVAQIPEHGMDALAALGIVLPVTLILTAFANLVGLGGSPRAGMKLGEGDKEEADKIFNNAFVLLAIIGAALTVVVFFLASNIVDWFGCPDTAAPYATSYLRIYACGTLFVMFAQGLNPFITTQGYSLTAMMSVLIGAITNIALDPLFIFVFGMGVDGASLATVISQGVSFVWIVLFFVGKRSIFKFKLSYMKLNAKRIWSMLTLGFSPFVMTITECAIQIVFNVCLNAATNGDKDYTAALTIMLSALQLISLPLNGMGYGMQPFVSYNYGKGDAARLKQGIKCVTIVAFVYAVIVWSLSMAFPVLYAYLFNASEEVGKIVVKYAPLFLMGSIMFFVQMTLQNINVALGQAASALLLAVMRKVIILIPLCIVLTKYVGHAGVYMSEGIADLVAGVITSIVIFTTFPKVFAKRAAQVQAEHAAQNATATTEQDEQAQQA